jgi:multidrug transporter EmrE-like cation transporter
LHYRQAYSGVFFTPWAGIVAVLGVWLYRSRDSAMRIAALIILILGVAALGVALSHGAFDASHSA